MPSVLIDATLINQKNTGLANVMQSLVRGFNDIAQPTFACNVLVPANYTMPASTNINFIPVRKWQKYLTFSLPNVNIWHSTYQSFRYLRKTNQTRQIVTIHDLNFLYEKNKFKAQRHLNILQQRINRADAVVTISQFVADDIKKNIVLNNKPLEVIYNCVENLQQQPAIKPSFYTNDAPFFFTLGAVRKKKNFHSLLEVMARITDHQLFIAGNLDSPEYLVQLQQQIAALKLTNVHITGPISSAEKIWLYQHAEAFLFPSMFEGFGLPVLEAMQFGTPVFISNMTSLPEVAGGYAFIWDNFNPDYMAESLLKKLSTLQSTVAQRDAMKAYATSFSLEKNIQQHLSLYHRLAGESITEA